MKIKHALEVTQGVASEVFSTMFTGAGRFAAGLLVLALVGWTMGQDWTPIGLAVVAAGFLLVLAGAAAVATILIAFAELRSQDDE